MIDRIYIPKDLMKDALRYIEDNSDLRWPGGLIPTSYNPYNRFYQRIALHRDAITVGYLYIELYDAFETAWVKRLPQFNQLNEFCRAREGGAT